MLRERNHSRMRWISATTLALALVTPAIAQADELTIQLREHATGVVVELRGMPANAASQEVITSKTGALLFLAEQTSAARRIPAPPKHRLDFVQVGQAGKKVAVRIVQRKRATGSLGKFMRSEAVPGGLDVFIDDGVPPPAAVEPTPVPDNGKSAALLRLSAEQSEAAVPVPVPMPMPDPLEEPAAAEAPIAKLDLDTKAAPLDDAPRRASPFDDEALSDTPAPNGRALGWIALASLCAFGSLALWKLRKRRTPAQVEPLRIVSRVALGPKQQIVWIVAGDRALLVGATEHGIALISELGRARTETTVDVVEPDVPTVTDPNAGGKIAAFKHKLRVALGDELAGKTDMPPHLELLTADPKWTRKDVA